MVVSPGTGKASLRTTPLLRLLKTLFPLEKDWSAHRLHKEIHVHGKGTYKYGYVTVTWKDYPQKPGGEHLYEISIEESWAKNLLDALQKSGIDTSSLP